jgi:hypothetical protein
MHSGRPRRTAQPATGAIRTSGHVRRIRDLAGEVRAMPCGSAVLFCDKVGIGASVDRSRLSQQLALRRAVGPRERYQ